MTLFYASLDSQNRCQIANRDLHCGHCFQVKVWGEWQDTRIELTSEGWVVLLKNKWHSAADYDRHEARFYT